MPPTKQPMLPAPATPIGLSDIIPCAPNLIRKFDSRLSHSLPVEPQPRRTSHARLVTAMARRYVLRAGGYQGENDGFTRCTQRDAARPARPEQSERAIWRRNVADDHGNPRAARLQGGQTFRRQPARG